MRLNKALSVKTVITTLTLTFIIVLSIILLTIVFGSEGDVDIVITNNISGQLANKITNELSSQGKTLANVTSITVTGNLNQTDLNWFASNRDSLTKIEILDLEGATATNLQIPNNFMNSKSTLKQFKYPIGIKSIGQFALSDTGLTGDLIIPNSVTHIWYAAFSRCTGFTGNLIIPNSVTYIEDSAFSQCSNLTGELIIPNSVTDIGIFSFGNCSNFTGDLIIPNSISSIEEGAFLNCSGLTGKIVIPDSVTFVDYRAFQDCTKISEIEMPYNIELRPWVNKNSHFDNAGSLVGGIKLTYTFPSETTVEGLKAITQQQMKDKLSKSTGITYKEGYVTNGTYTRKVFPVDDIHVVVENNVAGSLQSRIQEELLKEGAELGNILSITVTGELSQEDLYWLRDNKDNLTKMYKIDLENANATGLGIPDEFMKDNTMLTTFRFPSGITSIGDNAFEGCSNLEGDLVIPNSVVSIGIQAFYNCSGFDRNISNTKFSN